MAIVLGTDVIDSGNKKKSTTGPVSFTSGNEAVFDDLTASQVFAPQANPNTSTSSNAPAGLSSTVGPQGGTINVSMGTDKYGYYWVDDGTKDGYWYRPSDKAIWRANAVTKAADTINAGLGGAIFPDSNPQVIKGNDPKNAPDPGGIITQPKYDSVDPFAITGPDQAAMDLAFSNSFGQGIQYSDADLASMDLQFSNLGGQGGMIDMPQGRYIQPAETGLPAWESKEARDQRLMLASPEAAASLDLTYSNITTDVRENPQNYAGATLLEPELADSFKIINSGEDPRFAWPNTDYAMDQNGNWYPLNKPDTLSGFTSLLPEKYTNWLPDPWFFPLESFVEQSTSPLGLLTIAATAGVGGIGAGAGGVARAFALNAAGDFAGEVAYQGLKEAGAPGYVAFGGALVGGALGETAAVHSLLSASEEALSTAPRRFIKGADAQYEDRIGQIVAHDIDSRTVTLRFENGDKVTVPENYVVKPITVEAGRPFLANEGLPFNPDKPIIKDGTLVEVSGHGNRKTPAVIQRYDEAANGYYVTRFGDEDGSEFLVGESSVRAAYAPDNPKEAAEVLESSVRVDPTEIIPDQDIIKYHVDRLVYGHTYPENYTLLDRPQVDRPQIVDRFGNPVDENVTDRLASTRVLQDSDGSEIFVGRKTEISEIASMNADSLPAVSIASSSFKTGDKFVVTSNGTTQTARITKVDAVAMTATLRLGNGQAVHDVPLGALNPELKNISEMDFNDLVSRMTDSELIKFVESYLGPVRKPETKVTVEPEISTPTVSPSVVSFTTAKGSSYKVNPDGTTTRNKAARPEHPGDSGLKETSVKTIYVQSADAINPGGLNADWRMVINDDNTVSLVTRVQGGLRPWGLFPSAKNIPYSTTPTKGATPIEVWELDGPGYKKVHIGNPITRVNSRVPKGKAATQAADEVADEVDEIAAARAAKAATASGDESLSINPYPLPKTLQGAAPKYQKYSPRFESDLDKALYIVSDPVKRSPKDESYMDYLRPILKGMSDEKIRAAGDEIRAIISREAKAMYDEGDEAGYLDIPLTHRPSSTKKAPAPAAKPKSESAVTTPTTRDLTPDEIIAQVKQIEAERAEKVGEIIEQIRSGNVEGENIQEALRSYVDKRASTIGRVISERRVLVDPEALTRTGKTIDDIQKGMLDGSATPDDVKSLEEAVEEAAEGIAHSIGGDGDGGAPSLGGESAAASGGFEIVDGSPPRPPTTVDALSDLDPSLVPDPIMPKNKREKLAADILFGVLGIPRTTMLSLDLGWALRQAAPVIAAHPVTYGRNIWKGLLRPYASELTQVTKSAITGKDYVTQGQRRHDEIWGFDSRYRLSSAEDIVRAIDSERLMEWARDFDPVWAKILREADPDVTLSRADDRMLAKIEARAQEWTAIMSTGKKLDGSLPTRHETAIAKRATTSLQEFGVISDVARHNLLTKASREWGLHLSTGYNLPMSAREEAVAFNLYRSITGDSRPAKIAKAAMVPAGASDVAGSTFLTGIRADLFTSWYYLRLSKGDVPTVSEVKAMSQHLNMLTGRGNIPGQSVEQVSWVLNAANAIFLSPRFMYARGEFFVRPVATVLSQIGGSTRKFRTLSQNEGDTFHQAKDLTSTALTRESRMYQIKDYVVMAGLSSGILALMHANGMNVNMNPQATDFGSFEIPGMPNRRFSFFGGWADVFRDIYQLTTGVQEFRSGYINEFDIFSGDAKPVIWSKFRSKMTPIAGVIADWVFPPEYRNDSSMLEQMRDMFRPLIVNDIVDVFRDFSVGGLSGTELYAKGTAASLFSYFGGEQSSLREDKDWRKYNETLKDEEALYEKDEDGNYLYLNCDKDDKDCVASMKTLNEDGKDLAFTLHAPPAPKLKEAYESRVQADKARAAANERQNERDLRLINTVAGKYTDERALTIGGWKAQSDDAAWELALTLRGIYETYDDSVSQEMATVYSAYLDKINQYLDVNGRPDYKKVDAWVASLPANERKILDNLFAARNEKKTPLVQARINDREFVADRGFFDLDQDAWDAFKKKYPDIQGKDFYEFKKLNTIAYARIVAEEYGVSQDAAVKALLSGDIKEGTILFRIVQEAEERAANDDRVQEFSDTYKETFRSWIQESPKNRDAAERAWTWDYLNPDAETEAYINGDLNAFKPDENKQALVGKLESAGYMAATDSAWNSFKETFSVPVDGAKFVVPLTDGDGNPTSYEDFRDSWIAIKTAEYIEKGYHPAVAKEEANEDYDRAGNPGYYWSGKTKGGKADSYKGKERDAWVRANPELAIEAAKAGLIDLPDYLQYELGLITTDPSTSSSSSSSSSTPTQKYDPVSGSYYSNRRSTYSPAD